MLLNEKLHNYIENLLPNRNKLFSEMEQFARENDVPIMELAGIETLLQLLRIKQPKKILEVGTAIGYSALRMASALPEAIVVTIERDVERIEAAKQYIGRSGHDQQIALIEGDALEVVEDAGSHGPFDVIFIDAAKGQYQKFFEQYSAFLNKDGMIITDNVLFKGLVYESEIENKRIRNLVKKIHSFNEWLMANGQYHSVILPIGDGIAISKKRGEGE